MQNNDSVDMQVGSEEEMELIDKKLGEFNGQQVPFTQKLYYHLKFSASSVFLNIIILQ